MKIFKNILDKNTAVILLYGEISDDGGDGRISSRSFVTELMYLDENYQNLNIRINSVGGDVYPGIAIFNAIRQCRSNVTVYIDGIAASIAGVIALAGNRVEMSRYSRMMLHNVSGGCYGNKEDLKEMIATIEGLEDTIAEIISNRCGLTAEEIKQTYFDGADHWLKAEEALRIGLVDALYDVEEEVPAGSSTEEIYRIFTNRLDTFQPQNPIEMKLDDVKRIPRFANCADEEAAMAALSETATRADQADELERQNQELARQLNEQQQERIEQTVDEAVKDGRIDAGQDETYRNLLKNDFKNGAAVLKAMKPKRLLKNELVHETPGEKESAWKKRQSEIVNKYHNKK